MKRKVIAVTLSASALMFPLGAYAETIPQINTSLSAIIQNVTNWVLGIAGAVAVLMLVIGGVRYIISAGNPTQAEGAKKTIIYALVGIAIIALSLVLVNGVIALLQGSSS